MRFPRTQQDTSVLRYPAKLHPISVWLIETTIYGVVEKSNASGAVGPMVEGTAIPTPGG